MTMTSKIVTVDLGPKSYDIYIGSGLLYRTPALLPFNIQGRSVFIITDQNVQNYARDVGGVLREAGARSVETLALPPGEKTKNFRNVEKITSWLLENGVNRDSVLFAVGGGVIGDLGGFCASIILRGVPYVQIPTSLLAQVDSAVGGKTGINSTGGKNMIGSFYQPAAVIIDTDALKTLPQREFGAGYAEMVKYGLIRDSAFFNWLDQNSESLRSLDPEALAHAIDVSVRAKAAIVEIDEKEQGARALLNLGHTFGHALEAAAGFGSSLLHGEAVAMGTVMAMDLSVRMNLCQLDDFYRVERHFTNAGLLTRASFIQPPLNTSVDHLIALMHHDKKVKQGKITFILLRGIGDAFITSDVPENLLRDVLIQSLGGENSGNGPAGIKKTWNSIFSSRS
ncbi:MAG: 3-dehydroquinate synthase [Alphaproteobacteria bacterium]|nr:3-dehydroquinate synthase [Alphaproteobacteria bacterium]